MTIRPATYVRLAWPLTGRSKEMRFIEAALSDRDCRGITPCGAAGVGKSRIAREATTSAASNGYEVRWVVATSSARALPLAAEGVSGLETRILAWCDVWKVDPAVLQDRLFVLPLPIQLGNQVEVS